MYFACNSCFVKHSVVRGDKKTLSQRCCKNEHSVLESFVFLEASVYLFGTQGMLQHARSGKKTIAMLSKNNVHPLKSSTDGKASVLAQR